LISPFPLSFSHWLQASGEQHTSDYTPRHQQAAGVAYSSQYQANCCKRILDNIRAAAVVEGWVVVGGGWCVVCVVCGVWCGIGILGAEWFIFVYPGSQIESSSLSLRVDTMYVVPRLPHSTRHSWYIRGAGYDHDYTLQSGFISL